MVMAESCRHEGQLEEPHGERRALTAEILQGLGLRERGAWQDAAGPTGRAKQPSLRRSLADATGMVGDVGFEQIHPPPDHVPACNHSGRRSLQRATLPRPLATGEPQVEFRQSPQLQKPLSWQSMDLAHLARVTAGNMNTSTAVPIAAVPVERRPPGGPVMVPPSASSPLDGEAATSWYAISGGGRSGVGDPVRHANNHRDHRRGSRSQSQWNSYPGAGSPVSGRTPGEAEGWKARDRSLLGSGAHLNEHVGDRGALPAGRRLQSPDETSYRQHPSSMYAATRPKRMRHLAAGAGGVAGIDELLAARPAGVSTGYQHRTPSRALPCRPSASGGGDRYRDAQTLLPSTLAQPQREAYGRATLAPPMQVKGPVGIGAPLPAHCESDQHWQSHPLSSAAAEAALAKTSPSLPPTWDLGSGGRSGGGEARARYHGGGGLASLGLHRSGVAPGACTGPDFCGDDRLSTGSPPLRDQYLAHSTQPREGRMQQDHHTQLRSAMPPADTTITSPALSRGVSDPGVYGAAARRLLSGLPHSVRPSLPLAGLMETAASVGDQSVGGRNSCTCGELHCIGGGGADAFCDGTSGGAADAAREWRELRRFRKPLRRTTAKGCMGEGCDRRPRYGYKGSKKPAYCAKHRVVGMIDTRHPLCKNEQCTRQPSFGKEGDRRASYCARHREEGMVNVTSRRCQRVGCIRHPNFGFPGDRRASYCREHREMGMVDVVSRRCQESSCMRRPLYNFESLRPVWCSRHKLPGMIDVVSARCQEPGCLSHPSFGYASDKKARRCAKHRLKNMEGVKGRKKRPREVTDVVSIASTADTTANTALYPCSSSTSPSPSR